MAVSPFRETSDERTELFKKSELDMMQFYDENNIYLCGVRIRILSPSSKREKMDKTRTVKVEQHNRELEQLQLFMEQDIKDMAQKALEIIPERVQIYAEKIGVTYGRITIRNQRTKWGSCTSNGNLNFNCLLMAAPTEVLDSVVVHELCHRLHMNHSKEFYAKVYRIFPDYDKWNKWLKDNSSLLIKCMTTGANKHKE